MTPSSGTEPSRGIVRVVALYAVFAALWIFGSDWLLGQVVADPRTITQLSVMKGWAFVGVSAMLLYGALRRMTGAPAAPPLARPDWLTLAGVLAAVTLLAAAAIAVVYEQARWREGARLEAIAALKVQDVAAWFRHRASETDFIADSRYFAGLFRSVAVGDEVAKAC